MRLPQLATALLVSALLLPAASLAQRMPAEYEPPPQRSAAQEKEAASRAKYNIGSYQKDINPDVTPVPWMAVGLTVVAFAVAAMFAVPYYLRTAKMQSKAQEASEIRPRRIR